LGGEVVACDSTQVYRGFDIGTAKPTAEVRRGIPHHLLDLLEPGQIFHAGEYRRLALGVLGVLARQGKLPIFTVGTGLYLRALLEGLCEAPARSENLRARLRRIVEGRGHEHLHRVLERLDPVAAARIAPRDIPKTIRAIEVRLLAGTPISALHRAGQTGLEDYKPVKIGLMPPRDALYARIARRTQAMVEAGWIEEVRRLTETGVAADAKPFDFIGYREWREVLAGTLTHEKAIELIGQNTRRYAKRQITWFRRETFVHWIEGFGDDPGVAAEALAVAQAGIAEIEAVEVPTAGGDAPKRRTL
jgi:tRNA dimethylallyltransferase